MNNHLSDNAKAILLLTAPLLAGKGKADVNPLTLTEYNKLARYLADAGYEPADLLAPGWQDSLTEWQSGFETKRISSLLERGFLLAQAVNSWRERAIWVVSRADDEYPRRFKERLGANAPTVLYGCGNRELLENGGLAVVGSRNTSEELLEYTESIGRLAARAGCAIISGGAKGVDQAAMHGALTTGGAVAGVLTGDLYRESVNREHRDALMDDQLVLVSPYDPKAGFNAGHAMQRNKLIYALADAGLVIDSAYNEGGTWAGAAEQLDKLRLAPVYTRSEGEIGAGLEGLRRKGASPWPNPETPAEFREALDGKQLHTQSDFLSDDGVAVEPDKGDTLRHTMPLPSEVPPASPEMPAETIFATAEKLIGGMGSSVTESEVADRLQIEKKTGNGMAEPAGARRQIPEKEQAIPLCPVPYAGRIAGGTAAGGVLARRHSRVRSPPQSPPQDDAHQGQEGQDDDGVGGRHHPPEDRVALHIEAGRPVHVHRDKGHAEEDGQEYEVNDSVPHTSSFASYCAPELPMRLSHKPAKPTATPKTTRANQPP